MNPSEPIRGLPIELACRAFRTGGLVTCVRCYHGQNAEFSSMLTLVHFGWMLGLKLFAS